MLQPSVTKISLKIIFLRFYWNPPGANELIRCKRKTGDYVLFFKAVTVYFSDGDVDGGLFCGDLVTLRVGGILADGRPHPRCGMDNSSYTICQICANAQPNHLHLHQC